MVHVIYKGRALPLAWLVREGKKGHFPQQMHIDIVQQVQELIPPGADVVFLGDGEFDGTELQHTLHGDEESGRWSYVCRTALTTTATLDGQAFRLDVMGDLIQPGNWVALENVYVTAEVYGPVTAICWWGLSGESWSRCWSRPRRSGHFPFPSRTGSKPHLLSRPICTPYITRWTNSKIRWRAWKRD